ncbi:MAG: hypothetical protein U9N02_00115, partial [Campylobacterota bacterium]|nr:hypothetical protein [Campylobacterota bacterium]
VIQRNNAKIEIHNYYKGLSITNDAVISNISEHSVTITTKYFQQKAIQTTGKTLIVSDALPFNIECSKIMSINFEKQSVELKELHFVETSPIKRDTVRIVPEDKHKVSLFSNGSIIHAEIKIEDISLNAIRLKLDLFPSNIEKGTEVNLDIVLELDKKPLIINTTATLFRKVELKYGYSVVFIFGKFNKSGLTKYITKRQMAIIREFKGIQNG